MACFRRRSLQEMEVEQGADAAAPVRDWSELPLDPLASVFAKLGAVEVLMGAGLVCRSWLGAAKVPDLWRSVVMASDELVDNTEEGVLRAMAKVAVDRSAGRLKVFVGKRFVTDDLLKYIGDRSPSLKCLVLKSCADVSNEGFTRLTTKSPLLQYLIVQECPDIGGDAYELTGRACPQLKRFGLRKGWYDRRGGALGIATMRELRVLRLVGSDITTDELVAVVDGCPRLERLTVRDCYNVDARDATLRARCARIEKLTLPSDQSALERYYCDDYNNIWSGDCDEFDDWRSE